MDDGYQTVHLHGSLMGSTFHQPLMLTVKGMIYKILKMLVFLDSVSNMDVQKRFQQLVVTVLRPRDGMDENMSVPFLLF